MSTEDARMLRRSKQGDKREEQSEHLDEVKEPPAAAHMSHSARVPAEAGAVAEAGAIAEGGEAASAAVETEEEDKAEEEEEEEDKAEEAARAARGTHSGGASDSRLLDVLERASGLDLDGDQLVAGWGWGCGGLRY